MVKYVESEKTTLYTCSDGKALYENKQNFRAWDEFSRKTQEQFIGETDVNVYSFKVYLRDIDIERESFYLKAGIEIDNFKQVKVFDRTKQKTEK